MAGALCRVDARADSVGDVQAVDNSGVVPKKLESYGYPRIIRFITMERG